MSHRITETAPDAQQVGSGVSCFDNRGRRIPRNLQSAVCDSNTNFYLLQPEIDYTDRLGRFKEYCQNADISSDEFQEKIEQIYEYVGQDERILNLKNAVCLPIILSKQDIADYGQILEKLLESVGRAYENQFPNRKFYNHRKGTLKNQVSIVHDSHNRLVERMKQEQVVAIYFPNPLQGFSVNAQREQMKELPENILLAGGFDTATAMIMYPDILACWKAPGLDLAALSWGFPACALSFRADDDKLFFCYNDNLAIASVGYSGGLLLL